MSLNMCPAEAGAGKTQASSSAVSDGAVIKSQCPDQIVAWVITSFSAVPPAVLFGYQISVNGLSGC